MSVGSLGTAVIRGLSGPKAPAEGGGCDGPFDSRALGRLVLW